MPLRIRGGGCAASKEAEHPPQDAASQYERGLPPIKQAQAPSASAAGASAASAVSPPDALHAPPSSTAPLPSAAPPPSAARPPSATPPAPTTTPPSGVDAIVAEVSHRFVQVTSSVYTAFAGVPAVTEVASPAAPLPEAPATPEAVSPAAPLPEATRQLLTTLDDRLIEALEKGDIRLVRAAWLLAQPAGFRMINRQALEKRGDALLRPQEAANAIRAGTRSIGVLSHGWLSPVRRGRGRKHTPPRPLPRPDAPSPPHAVR